MFFSVFGCRILFLRDLSLHFTEQPSCKNIIKVILNLVKPCQTGLKCFPIRTERDLGEDLMTGIVWSLPIGNVIKPQPQVFRGF